MERAVANISGLVRRAKLLGRDFLVAPMTMLVPGVLNGSMGPLYYPSESVSRDVDSWNHMPLTLGHPSRDGQPVSARSPDILNEFGLGFVFGSVFNSELSAEGWFDEELTKQKDKRIWTALNENKPIELSTGLFTEVERAPDGAVHNTHPYTHVVRGMRPDHLAILPDAKGACSTSDGCGINNAGTNEPSHEQLHRRLAELLEKRFGAGMMAGMPGHDAMPRAWIVDVFDKEVVYEYGGKMWSLDYTSDLRTGAVTLADGAPSEVRAVKSYKPVANAESYFKDCPRDDKGHCKPSGKADAPAQSDADTGKTVTCKCSDGSTVSKPAAQKLPNDEESGAAGGRHIAVKNEASPTLSGERNMKDQLVTWLATNCSCWKGKQETLNKLDEPDLQALKDTAEQTANTQTLVANIRKEIGAADDADLTTALHNKLNTLLVAPGVTQNRLTAEEADDLAWARQERQRQKTLLVDRLLINVSDPAVRQAKGVALMKKPETELKELLELIPTPESRPTRNRATEFDFTKPLAPNYYGAAGGYVANAEEDDDPDDTLPIINTDYSDPPRRQAR